LGAILENKGIEIFIIVLLVVDGGTDANTDKPYILQEI
jgi:hypothetical protein